MVSVLATAEDVPPELFPTILSHLADTEQWADITKNQRRDLMNCSLVCVFWANHCRPYIFEGDWVLKSRRDLLDLEPIMLNRTGRLQPLAHMTHLRRLCLHLEQRLDSPTWFHWWYNSPLADVRDFCDLTLCGPPVEVADSDLPPRAVYRSPYWSLPRSMPPIYLHKFMSVILYDIRFPSLADFHALLGHLTFARALHIKQVTWDIEHTSVSLHQLLRANMTAGSEAHYITVHGCADNAVACMLAFQRLHPPANSPFSHMQRGELEACLVLARTVLDTNTIHVPPPPEPSPASFCWGYLTGASFSALYHGRLPGHVMSSCVELIISYKQVVLHDLGDPVDIQLSLSFLCDKTGPFPRVVALILNLAGFSDGDMIPEWLYISNVLNVLHPTTASFPHLQVVHVHSRLAFLQHAAASSPAPDRRHHPLYVWTCPSRDVPDTKPEYHNSLTIIDPLTAMPSARQSLDLPLRY